MSIWKTIRSYVWWTHSRGSFHYDVMVTLILLFIFLSPLWINFNDKPAERTPHQTGVVVIPDGKSGFIYRIEAAAVSGGSDAEIRDSLLRVIEPIAGEAQVTRYEPVLDTSGKTVAYRVWVERR
jgi:hypothetical protein